MIKNGLSVLLLKPQKGIVVVPSLVERLVVVSDHVGGFSSSSAAIAMGSRRFFYAGGITTSSSSSLMKRDMFQASGNDIPNMFRGRQTGGCVGSFIPHQCNKSHMLPYFARALASSSASQSSGQTPRQEPEKKKKECQIKKSSELQRERCDEISSTKVSLNQFPGLMVHGNVEDSKTRRLLRLNPGTGYFEEEQDVSAAASNHHGHSELQVPHGHVCRGSAYGWLFLIDDNFDMKLLNPFSGAEIQLPPVKTLPPAEESERWYGLCKWVIKAAFSANPSIEPRPVVLIIFGGQFWPRLAFCKPGDKGWTPLEFPAIDSFHMDAIYHKGQFYVLGWPGYVAAFDIGRRINDDDHSVKTILIATPPKRGVRQRDWYLVVLDGELVRFEVREVLCDGYCTDKSMEYLGEKWKWAWDYSDEDCSNEESHDNGDDRKKKCVDPRPPPSRRKFRIKTCRFDIKIRRFDASEKEWVKVESLGDKAVFLGLNTSFALSASDYPAGLCISDSIYIAGGCGRGRYASDASCSSTGIYNVKDKSLKPFYPRKGDKGGFPKPDPIWIVNSTADSAE